MSFRLEDDLGFLLSRTYHAMRRQILSRLESLDITYDQFRVLNALCEQDNIAQVTLAAKTASDKTSLTRMLDRMERAGLIYREADPDDSRVRRVLLTEEGRAMQSRVIPHRDLALATATEGLCEKEVTELKRLLNRIYDNVS